MLIYQGRLYRSAISTGSRTWSWPAPMLVACQLHRKRIYVPCPFCMSKWASAVAWPLHTPPPSSSSSSSQVGTMRSRVMAPGPIPVKPGKGSPCQQHTYVWDRDWSANDGQGLNAPCGCSNGWSSNLSSIQLSIHTQLMLTHLCHTPKLTHRGRQGPATQGRRSSTWLHPYASGTFFGTYGMYVIVMRCYFWCRSPG